MTHLKFIVPALVLVAGVGRLPAEAPSDQPKIVSVTRDEVKVALELKAAATGRRYPAGTGLPAVLP